MLLVCGLLVSSSAILWFSASCLNKDKYFSQSMSTLLILRMISVYEPHRNPQNFDARTGEADRPCVVGGARVIGQITFDWPDDLTDSGRDNVTLCRSNPSRRRGITG